MMIKNKKAQSALEFLTTYGWAFLVILIMIGALGYFGILNPTRYLPERCNVNTEIACEEFALTRDGNHDLTMQVVLSNAIGQAIDVNASSVEITSDVFSGALTGTNANCSVSSTTVSADDSFTLTCTPSGDTNVVVTLPGEGSKLKVGFTMQYTPQGRDLPKPIAGEVFGSLQ